MACTGRQETQDWLAFHLPSPPIEFLFHDLRVGYHGRKRSKQQMADVLISSQKKLGIDDKVLC